MVFPSRGCLTCKRRRVKCDYTRPTCTRCRKASRDCSWESNEETTLPFRSEIPFARGQPRRPWKKRPPNESIRHIIPLTTPSPLVSKSLSVPIKQQAFQYFVKNFLDWPTDMPDIGHDYLTYALCDWNRAGPGSSLRLAVSAFSFAVFWREKRVSEALEEADRFYARTIMQTQKEIKELSNERIDHLVVATMLMTNYETFMYGTKRQFNQNLPPSDEVGSRFWKNVCHYVGTIGLLQIRQQQGCPQNLPLYRAARRPIIRACILRGETVQKWLQDGARYGEEGPTLELDSLMIRVAALRSESLKVFRDKNPPLISRSDKVKALMIEAQDLDVALASWPEGFPEEWKFSVHPCAERSRRTTSDLSYDASVHSYTTHGHAAVWIRYLAVYLIVSSIRMRLLFTLTQRTSPGPPTYVQLEACQENISSLATDICRSVPFFFNSKVIQDASIRISNSEPEILPRLATILAWPLAVAVSTEAIPKAQKQWLQHRLKTVARVQGDATLESIAESKEFKF